VAHIKELLSMAKSDFCETLETLSPADALSPIQTICFDKRFLAILKKLEEGALDVRPQKRFEQTKKFQSTLKAVKGPGPAEASQKKKGSGSPQPRHVWHLGPI